MYWTFCRTTTILRDRERRNGKCSDPADGKQKSLSYVSSSRRLTRRLPLSAVRQPILSVPLFGDSVYSVVRVFTVTVLVSRFSLSAGFERLPVGVVFVWLLVCCASPYVKFDTAPGLRRYKRVNGAGVRALCIACVCVHRAGTTQVAVVPELHS